MIWATCDVFLVNTLLVQARKHTHRHVEEGELFSKSLRRWSLTHFCNRYQLEILQLYGENTIQNYTVSGENLNIQCSMRCAVLVHCRWLLSGGFSEDRVCCLSILTKVFYWGISPKQENGTSWHGIKHLWFLFFISANAKNSSSVSCCCDTAIAVHILIIEMSEVLTFPQGQWQQLHQSCQQQHPRVWNICLKVGRNINSLSSTHTTALLELKCNKSRFTIYNYILLFIYRKSSISSLIAVWTLLICLWK